jgi:hypothetical protein
MSSRGEDYSGTVFEKIENRPIDLNFALNNRALNDFMLRLFETNMSVSDATVAAWDDVLRFPDQGEDFTTEYQDHPFADCSLAQTQQSPERYILDHNWIGFHTNSSFSCNDSNSFGQQFPNLLDVTSNTTSAPQAPISPLAATFHNQGLDTGVPNGIFDLQCWPLESHAPWPTPFTHGQGLGDVQDTVSEASALEMLESGLTLLPNDVERLGSFTVYSFGRLVLILPLQSSSQSHFAYADPGTQRPPSVKEVSLWNTDFYPQNELSFPSEAFLPPCDSSDAMGNLHAYQRDKRAPSAQSSEFQFAFIHVKDPSKTAAQNVDDDDRPTSKPRNRRRCSYSKLQSLTAQEVQKNQSQTTCRQQPLWEEGDLGLRSVPKEKH